MTKIQVTSQHTIVKTPYVEIKKEKVKIGDTSSVYHTLYRAPAVMVFPLTESYEVYLISQYRYMFGKRLTEAVAGYIDKGESTLAAAKRELKEEIGLKASQWEELLRTELSASIIKATLHVFLARGLEEGEHNREVGEDIEVMKMPLDHAVAKAINGEIADATAVAGILLLDKLRREKKI